MKNKLEEKFHIDGIPTLVMLNGDTGEIINIDASGWLYNESAAENFPWKEESE